jgi:transposase InsO family protein
MAPTNPIPARGTRPSSAPGSSTLSGPATPGGGAVTAASSTTPAVAPGNIILTERFLSDPSWPADLMLDLGKSNWPEWSRRLELLADGQGFARYLDGTLGCPDLVTNPRAHWVWDNNDRSLRAFILRHISVDDYDIVNPLRANGACAIMKALQSRHEQLGLHVQVLTLRKALDVRFDASKSLDDTVTELRGLFNRIISMGPMDNDNLFSVLLINALGDQFTQLQSSIQSLSRMPTFCSALVVERIHEENMLLRTRTEQGATALVVLDRDRGDKPPCSNCKRTGHSAEFCVRSGGKMAGKTIEEARAAQAAYRAARKASRDARRGQTAQIATTSRTGTNPTDPTATTPAAPPVTTPAAAATPPQSSIVLNGITYYPGGQNAVANIAQSAMITTADGMPDPSAGYYNPMGQYRSYLALNENPHASVDWDSYSSSADITDVDVTPVTYTSSHTTAARLESCQFILDTGATCHISPERSDFKTLVPIDQQPIKGLGGAAVYAIGIGTVQLHIAAGHTLTLQDVLFVPTSNVRIISILNLNESGPYKTYFDPKECWVMNKSNTIIARGAVSHSRRLYILTAPTLRVAHAKPKNASYYSTTRVPDIETWHRRLGHCNTRTVIDMARSHSVEGMPIDLSAAPPKCDHCILGKQTRTPVPKVREGLRATNRLERVYIDLCGPMSTLSRSGRLYSMNIVDDFSGYVWSLPLRSKDEAAPVLQAWHRAVENQSGERLKILVTDNGELVSRSMSEWCSTHGIVHHLTAPYTSAHNGRAERVHRTLLGKARAMRFACKAPPSMWDEFCVTAAYLTTLTASTTLEGKTPFELWFRRAPSLSHLREIGCQAFALIPTQNPKISQRSASCTLIGYAPHSKAYRLWEPTSGRIYNSYHVTFIEHLDTLPVDLLPGTVLGTDDKDTPPSWDIPTYTSLPDASASIPHPDLSSIPIPPPDPPPIPNPPPNHNPPSIPHPPPLRRSERTHTQTSRTDSRDGLAHDSRLTAAIRDAAASTARRQEERVTRRADHPRDHTHAFLSEFSPVRDSHELIPLDLCTGGSFTTIDEVLSAIADGTAEAETDMGDDPTWKEAIASPEREYWIAGGREELKSLEDLKVFVLVPRSDVPQGQRPLKGKLVCKRKRDDSGKVIRYKVRYVAKGYAQQYGIDYDKTTAPTARLESFRTILHIAATLGWELQQFDIKTAFLHGVLPEDETMYMEQPPGFEVPGKEEWVMRLMKSIYGMKQASRIWNQTFHKAVQSWGFERLACEWCVYRRETPLGTIMFAVHVDDIICAGSSSEEINRFKTELRSQWEISDLGPAKFALGIAIVRDLEERTIAISQTALIDRVVDQFGQVNAHSVDTPMVPGLQLRRPDKSIPIPSEIKDWVERTPYRSLVGSLMYIAVGTRPDIAYAVGRLASFLDCYRPEHWEAAIRVLKYLKGTRLLSLVLGGHNTLQLTGYSDSDYANCPDTSRSIGGYCYDLGSGVVSWSSRKQRTVADSSCYAEYIALHDASHEVVFLRQLLSGLQLLPPKATTLHCDNDAASKLTEDHVWHSRVKHIRVKYHYVREQVLNGEIIVQRVRSSDNTADIFTKPLGRSDFQRLRQHLGLRSLETMDT